MVWSTVSYCASEKASVTVTCIGVSHSTSVSKPSENRSWHWWRCRVWLMATLVVCRFLFIREIVWLIVWLETCVERSTSYSRRVVGSSSWNASLLSRDFGHVSFLFVLRAINLPVYYFRVLLEFWEKIVSLRWPLTNVAGTFRRLTFDIQRVPCVVFGVMYRFSIYWCE
jgi:hypothetical protein